MYKVGNGIKNGKKLTQNAGYVFEDNIKDINFIYFLVSNFKEKHPDYISKIEKFYQMDIEHILKKLIDSKDDLRKIESDFEQMVNLINKFNGNHSLILQKTNPKALPKLRPEVVEILKTGSLADKRQILLDYIDTREKKNNVNVSETIKLWDSPSRKNFEGDINNLRDNSIGFIKRGLLAVTTKEEQPEDC